MYLYILGLPIINLNIIIITITTTINTHLSTFPQLNKRRKQIFTVIHLIYCDL